MNQNSDFKIVLFHDGFASGMRGVKVFDQLAAHLKQHCVNMGLAIWKFEVLRELESRKKAIATIKEANMVMVSAASGSDLPGHIQNWLERALSRRQCPDAAMVALLDVAPGASRRGPLLGKHLQAMAVKVRMDFFCHPDDGLMPLVPRPAIFAGEKNFMIIPPGDAWAAGIPGGGVNHGQN